VWGIRNPDFDHRVHGIHGVVLRSKPWIRGFECRALTAPNLDDWPEMLGYLNITGLKTALLLNFKHARLGIKRVSN
jgi:hypothetical protein